jgi:hypothetical protein
VKECFVRQKNLASFDQSILIIICTGIKINNKNRGEVPSPLPILLIGPVNPPLVGSYLLVGDVDFSMRRRRKCSGWSIDHPLPPGRLQSLTSQWTRRVPRAAPAGCPRGLLRGRPHYFPAKPLFTLPAFEPILHYLLPLHLSPPGLF